MGGVLGPLLTPLIALFGGVAALLGIPALLADAERRARRVGLMAVVVAGFFLVHGELRSDPVIHAAFIALSGSVGAVLFGLGLRRWSLRRALLAERPRSPDEWTPGEGPRLWVGRLQARLTLPAGDEDGPCLYRRVEIDRWDAGRWRRVARREEVAEGFELAGKSRSLALPVARAALRRAALELSPFHASPDGWRWDPDPDPNAVYRSRTLGLLQGSRAQALGRVEREGDQGLVLQRVRRGALSLTGDPTAHLGRESALLLMGASLCLGFGLWGAWP